MKLLELQVEGYRSLKNVTWKPRDLNVIIGPNGSGKTNLIKGLELLSASAQGRLSSYVQNDGGILSMAWDGQKRDLRFRIRTSGVGGLSLFLTEISDFRVPQDLDYELDLGYGGIWDRPPPGHWVSGESLTVRFGDSEHTPAAIQKWIEREKETGRAAVLDFRSQTLEDVMEPSLIHESVLSLARPPFLTNPAIADFHQSLASWALYQELWSRVYPASPRGSATTSIRTPSVASYETQLSRDGGNLVNVLHTLYSDREFEREINDAMNAAFPDAFERLEFPPAGDQLIQMRIRWKGLQRGVSAANLSDGTLRFLFLIAVLANPKPPPLIVIEEPEIGLHPRMMSIIAEYAVDAAERTQVVFTTHSPDFLSAFRDTIPTTTVCNWENGETVLQILSGQDLDYWLKDYTLGELYRSGHLESME